MLGVTQWGRQIRFLLGLPGKRRYTVEQVQQFLHGDSSVGDNADIQQMVQRLPLILGDPRIRRRYEGFQRYVEVLPRIIFQYNRGTPVEAITAGLSFLATDVGVERVIWITSEVIAEHLNRAP